MSRIVWIAVVCGVAFVAYTAWQRSQLAPRVPTTAGAGTGASGGGGLLDGITRTVDKLKGLFQSVGGTTTTPAPPPSSSGVAWV